MFLSISNWSFNTIFLTIINKANLIYILNFKLFLSITKYINFYLIFNDIYIKNPKIVSNIKLNIWIFNCVKNYQFNSFLVIDIMIEVFYNKFYR